MRFGRLLRVDHHSPPDDPPDLTLHFTNEVVALEHTLLKPYPLGWANAIRRSNVEDTGGFVPPIVPRSWTREELVDVVLGIKPVWTGVADTYDATLTALVAAIAGKVGRLPTGGIIVVDDRVTYSDHERETLIRSFEPLLATLGKCTVIYLQRGNSLQFWSALLTQTDVLMKHSEI